MMRQSTAKWLPVQALVNLYMFVVQRRYEGSTGFPFIFIYPQTNVFIRYEEGTLTFYYNCWLVLPAMISKLGRKLSEVNCKVTPRLQVTVSHWRRWWCLTRSLCIISISSVASCLVLLARCDLAYFVIHFWEIVHPNGGRRRIYWSRWLDNFNENIVTQKNINSLQQK